MKENIVEIRGHKYRYAYDQESKKMKYLGPLGNAPPITEDEFLTFAGLAWFPGSKHHELLAAEFNDDLKSQLSDLPMDEIDVMNGRITMIQGTETIQLPRGGTKVNLDKAYFFWWNEPELESSRPKEIQEMLKDMTPYEVVHIESIDFKDKDTAERIYNVVEDTWKKLGKKKVIVEAWPNEFHDPPVIEHSETERFYEELGFAKITKFDIGMGESLVLMEKDLSPMITSEGL
jgi:hypothetical protein